MDEPEQPDYYGDLEIDFQSTVKEIKRAFYRLAKLCHPDKQAPGFNGDAIREAQVALCNELRRREYDRTYPEIRLQWLQHRKEVNAHNLREQLNKVEEERNRRKATEESAKKEAEAERRRKLAEDQRLAALKAEKERLRAQKEIRAEERSREAGRRAQERQEREAKERLRRAEEQKAEKEREERECLRRTKEKLAQERSSKALKQRREQQEKEAKERLVQILVEERQDTIRKNWTTMRAQAESRHLQPTEIHTPALNGTKSYLRVVVAFEELAINAKGH
ncbi:Cald1p [Xylographa bjoerkii]|nr:Cald1p [Xylographa bjoerkii]